jgi:hypothetical protein
VVHVTAAHADTTVLFRELFRSETSCRLVFLALRTSFHSFYGIVALLPKSPTRFGRIIVDRRLVLSRYGTIYTGNIESAEGVNNQFVPRGLAGAEEKGKSSRGGSGAGEKEERATVVVALVEKGGSNGWL